MFAQLLPVDHVPPAAFFHVGGRLRKPLIVVVLGETRLV
jgi:hypothetical protein